jgi:hypothetical protein
MFNMKKIFSCNGLETRSPFKQVMSSAEITQALRTKREKTGTGGITMDNSLVGIGTGTAVKAGIKTAASKLGGRWAGKKAGAVVGAGIELYELGSKK